MISSFPIGTGDRAVNVNREIPRDPEVRNVVLPDRDAWSVMLGPAEDRPPRECVVLIPPMTDDHLGGKLVRLVDAQAAWDEGFQCARAALEVRSVRLVGRGVTTQRYWPAWVASSRRLLLTEFDAYLPQDKAALIHEIATEVERWLSEVFVGSFSGLPAERILWGSAVHRFLQPAFWSWPAVVGLLHHHASHDVLCTDAAWIGCQALARGIERAGGSYRDVRVRKTRVPYAFTLGFQFVLNACAVAARRSYEYWRERASRSALRASRLAPNETPRLWLGVHGNNPAASRHVIEGALTRGPSSEVGVLLVDSLRPAQVRPEDYHGRIRSMFPVLAHPLLEGRTAAVEQCVTVETSGDLLVNLAKSMALGARACARLASRGRQVQFGPISVDLSLHVPELARLATFDVVRAREACFATKAAARRRDFAGSYVIWPQASLASQAAADLEFQRAGATTYDLLHGVLCEPLLMMHEHTWSKVKVFWTEPETRMFAPRVPGQSCVGGYVPRRLPPLRRAPTWTKDRRLRLLALTSYLYDTRTGGRYPYECYQEAFLEALRYAAPALPLEIRWRPHPADHRVKVRELFEAYRGVVETVSLEPEALQGNLAWSDAVVTSMSSSILESLCHPIPVFVHDVPFNDHTIFGLISPERRFRTGEELRQRIEAFLFALAKGDTQALRAEEELRLKLFGPGGKPKALEELFWQPPEGDRIRRPWGVSSLARRLS
jgi:hypothetical protein